MGLIYRFRFICLIGIVLRAGATHPLALPSLPMHHILQLTPSALLWRGGQHFFLGRIAERERNPSIYKNSMDKVSMLFIVSCLATLPILI